ncbi:MAG: DUF971 family protein [Saprospiraceae bacterium]|jgi:DUF971 family protein
MATPKPTDIIYHQQSKQLEVSFDDKVTFNMSAEFLRVNSPSAEVQGHGPGQAVLQLDKEDVGIDAIEPTGNYAVTLRFSDGHDTGIFSWEGLYKLGSNHDELWNDYLSRLEEAGHQRKAVN